MSKEECPPGAIIIVFINCIVDGSWVTQQVGFDECLCDGNSSQIWFCPELRVVFVKNACWEIYLVGLEFSLGTFYSCTAQVATSDSEKLSQFLLVAKRSRFV